MAISPPTQRIWWKERIPRIELVRITVAVLVLTAHGLDVLLVWMLFFEMAVLYFASAILLNCRIAAPRVA